MTKEEAIEEINKAFEPAFANYIITALTEGATVSDKALEQPTMDKAMIHTLAKENDELKAEIGRLRQALEQNTVSEEVYTAEYNARKQAEYELWKIKEQQSDDCISRAEAIDTIKHWFSDMLETGKEEYSIDDVLNSLPPVTPTLPKGATNGDIIKAMFNCMVIDITNGKVYVEKIYFPFNEEWWNAPYKRGNEND